MHHYCSLDCRWVFKGGKWTCPDCGIPIRYKTYADMPPPRNCRRRMYILGMRGLGDAVYLALKYAGINALLKGFGITCNCGKRQLWLNQKFPFHAFRVRAPLR